MQPSRRSSRIPVHRAAAAAAIVLLGGLPFAAPTARAAPVDFSNFQVGQGIPSANGATPFDTPNWQLPTTFNNFPVDPGRAATETTNSDTNFFYGPASLTLHNTVIRGDIYAGSDDDPIGIGIGLPIRNGQSQNPLLTTDADYLLLQWKGASQNFDYVDVTQGFPFHNSTVGGDAPVGLSLSRVKGIPTADEFWQRADLTMYDPQGKTAPDPATDPVMTPDSGGLTQLGRGLISGNRPYNRNNRRHQFEITYTPTNIKVFVNGILEFDMNAPAGNPFPEGTLGLYEQAQSPSGAYAYFDVRPIGTPAPPPSTDLNPAPPVPFSGGDLSVPSSTANAGSTWQVVRGTPAPENLVIDSAANVADVEFSITGNKLGADSGVLLASVRQNGPRANGANSQFAAVEAPAPSGFGTGTGINTVSMTTGGEWNVDVAVAHFPYAAGFKGGYVSPTGAVIASNNSADYTVTQKQVPLPSIVKWAYNIDGTTLPAHNPPPAGQQAMFFAGNQQFMTNLRVAGKSSNTNGLLFTISSSNEDNYTSVAPLADGSWNVAVRDVDHAFYGGPDTFEQDDFAFLYLEPGDVAGSAGGRVTGLAGGNPVLQQSWGSFVLSRIDTGRYALSITGGEIYEINILNQALVGDFSFTDSGGTRTFSNTQDLNPVPVDSSFSFAFIPYAAGNPAAGGMLLLMPNDSITLSDGTVAPLNYFMTYQVAIPEPAAIGLFGISAAILFNRRRARKY